MLNTSKKILLTSTVILLAIVSLIVFNKKVYQPQILGDLKLRYISTNNYFLIYKHEKLAGKITAVDSWYVQKPYVFGSTTDFKSFTGDEQIYFFINVCNGARLQTKNLKKFEKYLDSKDIPKNKRNWMSGDNAIDIKKAEYNSDIDCDKF